MLFAPDMLDSVCFVYANMDGHAKPVGTAFFVALPIGETGLHTTVIVTALHVIAKIEQKSDDQRTFLRVNGKDGGFVFAEVATNAWYKPDQSVEIVDVAFCPWTASQDDVRIKAIPIDNVATPDVMAAEELGVGSEVFFVGLFVNHHGKKRNEPIVRVGNLAAIPSEPVATKVGDLDAYLVEARSVGGLSGSPVFLDAGVFRHVDGARQYRREGTSLYLLGVMHGHFEMPKEDAQVDDGISTEYVNMGIAVVTPIDKLLSLIDASPMPAVLDAATRKLSKQGGPPTPGSIEVKVNWPENP